MQTDQANLIERCDPGRGGERTTPSRPVDEAAERSWVQRRGLIALILEHGLRVGSLGRELARVAGFDETGADAIAAAATLHDFGKLLLDRNLLLSSVPLSSDDWVLMKRHPGLGAALLRTLEPADSALRGLRINVCLFHHERWDGSGYPQRLSGRAIPLEARIIAIADAYDALVSGRPYKAGWSEHTALAYIGAHGGSRFDPDLTRLFVAFGTERLAEASLRIDHSHAVSAERLFEMASIYAGVLPHGCTH